MKTYWNLLENKKFETDDITVDDKEISDYLKTNKIVIVGDPESSLFGRFKKSKAITKEKVLGTLNGISSVYINLKLDKRNDFYYFAQKDKTKVQKMLKEK